MIWAAVITLYLLGYVAGTAGVIRWQDWSRERCHHWNGANTPRSQCQGRYSTHGEDCWRPGPRNDQIVRATLAPLAWPVLMFPALAYWIATRSNHDAVRAARIAELERELDMREDR